MVRALARRCLTAAKLEAQETTFGRGTDPRSTLQRRAVPPFPNGWRPQLSPTSRASESKRVRDSLTARPSPRHGPQILGEGSLRTWQVPRVVSNCLSIKLSAVDSSDFSSEYASCHGIPPPPDAVAPVSSVNCRRFDSSRADSDSSVLLQPLHLCSQVVCERFLPPMPSSSLPR